MRALRSLRHDRISRVWLERLATEALRAGAARQRGAGALAALYRETRVCRAALDLWLAFRRRRLDEAWSPDELAHVLAMGGVVAAPVLVTVVLSRGADADGLREWLECGVCHPQMRRLIGHILLVVLEVPMRDTLRGWRRVTVQAAYDASRTGHALLVARHGGRCAAGAAVPTSSRTRGACSRRVRCCVRQRGTRCAAGRRGWSGGARQRSSACASRRAGGCSAPRVRSAPPHVAARRGGVAPLVGPRAPRALHHQRHSRGLRH